MGKFKVFILLLPVLVALVPFFGTGAQKENAAVQGFYQVKTGDTCTGLAQEFGLASYLDLYKANSSILDETARFYGYADSKNCNLIFPGEILSINAVANENGLIPSDRAYTVKAGDSCSLLAEKFKGSTSELFQQNQVGLDATASKLGFGTSQNCHWIFPGEVLILPANFTANVSAPAPVASPAATSPTPKAVSTPTATPSKTALVPASGGTKSQAEGSNFYTKPWFWGPIVGIIVLLFIAAIVGPLLIFRRRSRTLVREEDLVEAEKEPLVPPEKVTEAEEKHKEFVVDNGQVDFAAGKFSKRRHRRIRDSLNLRPSQVTEQLFYLKNKDEELADYARRILSKQKELTVWTLENLGLIALDRTVNLYKGVDEERTQYASSMKVERATSFTLAREVAKQTGKAGVIVAKVPLRMLVGSYLSSTYPSSDDNFEFTVGRGEVSEVFFFREGKVPLFPTAIEGGKFTVGSFSDAYPYSVGNETDRELFENLVKHLTKSGLNQEEAENFVASRFEEIKAAGFKLKREELVGV